MGKLFVIPTPVGNLEDLTFRAMRILKEADFILAEDTRTSGKLLKHYKIENSLVSHHKFNERRTLDRIISRIKTGETAALISDAGTPVISDPGQILINACIKKDIPVECLPGPTALIPALVNSGMTAEQFTFEGFLPVKKGRQTRLKQLADETRTMIFYESPHRLIKTLTQFREYFGDDRKICVSRELTKIHEENVRGTAVEIIEYYQENPLKGEIVVVVEGKR